MEFDWKTGNPSNGLLLKTGCMNGFYVILYMADRIKCNFFYNNDKIYVCIWMGG